MGVLHPDVVVRADAGPRAGLPLVVRGAAGVAARASSFADPARVVVPALVNGDAGVVITKADRVVTVMAFTVVDGRIVEIDSLADPERLASVQASLPTISR